MVRQMIGENQTNIFCSRYQKIPECSIDQDDVDPAENHIINAIAYRWSSIWGISSWSRNKYVCENISANTFIIS